MFQNKLCLLEGTCPLQGGLGFHIAVSRPPFLGRHWGSPAPPPSLRDPQCPPVHTHLQWNSEVADVHGFQGRCSWCPPLSPNEEVEGLSLELPAHFQGLCFPAGDSDCGEQNHGQEGNWCCFMVTCSSGKSQIPHMATSRDSAVEHSYHKTVVQGQLLYFQVKVKQTDLHPDRWPETV